MTQPEFDDNRIVRDARINPDPWVKQGISEAEYDENLAARRLKKFDAVKAELQTLVKRLMKMKGNQEDLVRWLMVQYRLDWNSYDLRNAMDAGQRLVSGDRRGAKLILDGIIGLLDETPRSSSRSVHPTPYVAQGNIKYTGEMRLELDEKPLLKSIGSAFVPKHKKHNYR